MGERTYRLTLAYDGTRYRGWQRLPNGAPTVQASVERALSELFGREILVSGSGRTDAGVHAEMQVASFTAPERPVEAALEQLRRRLPEEAEFPNRAFCPYPTEAFCFWMKCRSFPRRF